MKCEKCGKEMYNNTSSNRWVCWNCGNQFYRYQGDEKDEYVGIRKQEEYDGKVVVQ